VHSYLFHPNPNPNLISARFRFRFSTNEQGGGALRWLLKQDGEAASWRSSELAKQQVGEAASWRSNLTQRCLVN